MTRSRPAEWLLVLTFGLSAGCGVGSVPDVAETAPLPTARDVVGKGFTPHSTEPPPVEVTPRAAAAVKKAFAEIEPPATHYLRLSWKPGGCTGVIQMLDLDPEVTAEDRVFVSGGVTVTVAEKQLDHFRGSRVDYVDEVGQRGFKITNPKREAEAAKLPPCPVPDDDEDEE